MRAAELVGRANELAVLGEAFESVRRGRSQSVLVRGEAGMGKTRLMAEFLSTHAEVRVLRGRCPPGSAVVASYAPLLQMMRGLADAGLIDELPAHHLEALRPVLPIASAGPPSENLAPFAEVGRTAPGSAWTEARLFEVVLSVLRRLAHQQPLVVLVEDVHWADNGTSAFLQFLTTNLALERVLLLVTQRVDEIGSSALLAEALAALQHSDATTIVDLPPLDDVDARELIAGVLPGQGDDAALLRLGHGNPLFLEQLVTARVAGHELEVPAPLEEMLRWRLGLLTRAAQTVLDVISVAGMPLPYGLLTEMVELDVDALDDALKEVQGARLIDGSRLDIFAFHHELLADVVYRGVPPGRRRRLHRALARQLVVADGRDATSDAQTARHWLLGDRPDAAVEPLLRCALAARDDCRQEEAARRFGQLLDVWPDSEHDTGPVRRCDIIAWRADSLRWTVAPDEVVTAYRHAARAADLLDDDTRRGVVRERFARALVDSGQVDEAVEVARQAVDLLSTDSGADMARALATLSAILMAQADFSDSARQAELALAIAERASVPLVAARANRILGVDLANLGRLDEALRCLEAALETCRRESAVEDQIHTHINLSYVLERAGRWDASIASARSGRQIAAQSGLEQSLGVALLCNEVSALIASARWTEAQAASNLSWAAGASWDSRLYLQLIMAELAVSTGDLEVAEEYLAKTAGADHETSNLGQRRIVETMLARARHDPYLAYETALGGAVELKGRVEPYVLLRICADGLRALADLDSPVAQTLLRSRGRPTQPAALLDIARRYAADVSDLEPCRLLLALADAEASRASRRGPGEGWPAVALAARALGQTDVFAYAQFRAAAAAELARRPMMLTEAHWTATQLRAGPLVGEIETYARDAGVELGGSYSATGPPAANPRLQPFGLTAREREVLDCLVSGKSNRMIARTLGISEKTASVHVSNILRKMQLRSRTEVMYAVTQLALTNPKGIR